tara:strand:- start:511 stop:1065 length:555 start_codon:yes stop_codon:yes gene_type:complete
MDSKFKNMVLKFMITAFPKDKQKMEKSPNAYLFKHFQKFSKLMIQNITGPKTLVNSKRDIKNYVKKKTNQPTSFMIQFYRNLDPRSENVKSLIRNLLELWSHEQQRMAENNVAIRYKFKKSNKKIKATALKKAFAQIRNLINSKNVSDTLTSYELEKMRNVLKLSKHEYNTFIFVQKEYVKYKK